MVIRFGIFQSVRGFKKINCRLGIWDWHEVPWTRISSLFPHQIRACLRENEAVYHCLSSDHITSQQKPRENCITCLPGRRRSFFSNYSARTAHARVVTENKYFIRNKSVDFQRRWAKWSLSHVLSVTICFCFTVFYRYGSVKPQVAASTLF